MTENGGGPKNEVTMTENVEQPKNEVTMTGQPKNEVTMTENGGGPKKVVTMTENVEQPKKVVTMTENGGGDEQCYKVEQVQQLLGVSRQTLYKLMTRGELAFVKLCKCRRIPRRAVKRLIDRNLVGGDPVSG
jgi:excisionase family DNA binding protein